MWPSLQQLRNAILIASLALPCTTALPQAPSPSPSPTPLIPWSTKYASLRAHILSQPDTLARAGFSSGPTISQTFADGTCFGVRFYNWNCRYDVAYKMAGVVAWLDGSGVADVDMNAVDAYRYYTYGNYADPEDGWGFYGVARLAFGACGNRGPQSACGMTFCVDADGTSAGGGKVPVPQGETPYMDPNNRDNLCPWLKANGTVGSVV